MTLILTRRTACCVIAWINISTDITLRYFTLLYLYYVLIYHKFVLYIVATELRSQMIDCIDFARTKRRLQRVPRNVYLKYIREFKNPRKIKGESVRKLFPAHIACIFVVVTDLFSFKINKIYFFIVLPCISYNIKILSTNKYTRLLNT